jgi:hypothetical protein
MILALANLSTMRAPRPMDGRTLPVVLALLLAAAGCGGDHVTVPPGEIVPPPQVVEVYPASRAEHVPYDLAEMWVRFGEALDSTTVTASNVFLKLNTRRARISVQWDAATRRILIHPLDPMDLSETYTIELRPELATQGGVALGSVYWWQFTVSGIRRLRTPYPADSATTASPFTPLTWDRTESAAGDIVYDLYVDSDSAAVAQRTVTPLRKTTPDHVPYPTAWGFGRRYYWAVTTRNRTLDEVEDGPVWSFSTMPGGAPVDSVVVHASYYAYYDGRQNRTSCTEGRVIIGQSYQAVMRWNLTGVQPGRTVAAARVIMTLVTGSIPPGSTILSTKTSVPTNCQLTGGAGAPLGRDALAGNSNFGNACYYSSDALVAHVAAMHRGVASAQGFTFTSNSQGASFGAPADMVIYFYR